MRRLPLMFIAAGALLASGAGTAASFAAGPHEAGRFVTVQYGPRQAERIAELEQRESRIRNRIERGVHDGGITPPEARELFRELRHIREKAQAFRSDDRMDRREFDELNADLDRLAARVRHERWDEQRRY